MFIDHRFPTQFGRALHSEPHGMTIPTEPAAAMAFAFARDREADAMLAAGRFEQAERLSHAALEARCRATGERA
jgi:hypothetical protein